MRGWYGNRYGHSLASKGIKSSYDIINQNRREKEILDIVYNAKVEDILPEDIIYQYVEIMHRDHDDFVDGDLGDRIEEFEQFRLEKIKLERLPDNEWDVDLALVNFYKQQHLDSKLKDYPPIVVKRYKGGDYSIIDGIHRTEALKDIKGKKYILAWVGEN